MFKFINKLFEKPKETKEETVTDIEAWIKDKKELCEGKIKPELHDFSNEAIGIIEKIQNELIRLKDASLKNPNIPKKAMHIMEGNRNAYIKRSKDFLGSLDTDIQDSEDASQFIRVYKQGLEELGKSNAKSNMILNEFFSDNTKKISISIKQLENLVKGLDERLRDTGNEGIDRIKELNQQLSDKNKHQKEMQAQLDSLQKDLLEETTKKQEIIKKMDEIKSSDDYIELNELKKSKNELTQKNKAFELKLKTMFSDIETALKKYSRLSLEQKRIESYLDNPINALLNDSGLKIVEILKSLEKNIHDEKIALKPKKKEKTLMAIDNFSESTLVSVKDEVKEVNNKKKEVEEKLTKNTVMNNFAEQEYLHTHSVQKIKQLNRAIVSNTDHNKNIKIDDIHKDIKRIALNSLRIKLSLAS